VSLWFQEEKKKHTDELKSRDEEIKQLIAQLNATEEASKLRIEKLEVLLLLFFFCTFHVLLEIFVFLF
jgi:chaperonin cofactor prefoldin